MPTAPFLCGHRSFRAARHQPNRGIGCGSEYRRAPIENTVGATGLPDRQVSQRIAPGTGAGTQRYEAAGGIGRDRRQRRSAAGHRHGPAAGPARPGVGGWRHDISGTVMAHDFRFSLHTWTIDTTPLATCLDAAARAGYDAVELRRSDFVACFEQGMSRRDVVAMIRDSGIRLGVLGTEYGWFFATGAEQARLFDVLRESCEIASELGCDMIMSAPSQLTGTVDDAIAATRTAGAIVAEHGIRLALEFNSQHPVVNQTAVLRQIITEAGQPCCGMLLDAYHLHRSRGVAGGLDGVTADELFVFQYSDAPAQPTPGVRRPVDRLAPGDGVIDWTDLFTRLRDIGYRGYLSYEAPNPALWARDPYAVCAEGLDRTRALLERSGIGAETPTQQARIN